MLEQLEALAAWHARGVRAVVATLVGVQGSAPRDPGAVMAIAQSGELLGSISGGCVEAALAQEAELVFAQDRARSARFGVSDAQAQAVGLSCGGTLQVLLDEPDPHFVAQLASALNEGDTLLALALRAEGPQAGSRLAIFAQRSIGTLGMEALDHALVRETRASALRAPAAMREFGKDGEPHGEVRVFVQRIAPKPHMYLFGAIDLADALARVARGLGYDVTLCDARAAFATASRFPNVDRIVVEWPDAFVRGATVDEETVIVGMTHDERFDVPLLRAALETRAGYIGMMGSRRTNARRMEALRAHGVREEQLARIHAPIGLDIGARTPEETAISIAAEIVALRYGRSGGMLRDGHGPLRGELAPR